MNWRAALAGVAMAASAWLAAPSAPAAAQETQGYDPLPFLAAMINYRRTALTCAQVLGAAPVQDSASIASYLQALGQEPPTSLVPDLDRTVKLVIRSQGAAICQDRLRQAYARYYNAARIYEADRPAEWPPAPIVSPGPWCQTAACTEFR